MIIILFVNYIWSIIAYILWFFLAYKIKHSRDLIHAISHKINGTSEEERRIDVAKNAYALSKVSNNTTNIVSLPQI